MDKYCPRCFERFSTEVAVCPEDGTNLVALDDKDLVGQTLDNRYVIQSRIGKGGMGVVYRAEQHLIKRVVALKVLSREVVKDETSVKRFLNEARVIASLENPHTVTLYDFGVTGDGLLYYTMELLDGQPLSQLIHETTPVPFERAAQIIFQTLESLEEAHNKGILHRDIKPDNLFILNKGGVDRVKVLDFGIAKLVGESSGESITRTGMICGTPQYLSPEQVLGNQAVPASDLYSLGIVLYEMLAGQPPFYSPTPMKLLLQHLNDTPVPVTVKNPQVEVPASFNDFLKRALEKDPSDRFASVDEFRKTLLEALAKAGSASATEELAGITTTSAGYRALSAEGAPDTSRRAENVVHHTQTPRPAGSIVDTSQGLEVPERTAETPTRPRPTPVFDASIAEEETAPMPDEERTELEALVPGGSGRRKGVLIGVGVAVAVVVLVLLIWQPWAGVPAGPEVSAAAPAGEVAKPPPAQTPVAAPEIVHERMVADVVSEPAADAQAAVPSPDVERAADVVATRADVRPVEVSSPDVQATPPTDVRPQEVASPTADVVPSMADVTPADSGASAGGVQAADEARKAEAEARARREAEAEARRKAAKRRREKEEARRRAEEAAKKKAAEEAARRKAAEEAARRKAAEEAAKKKAEEEKKKNEGGGFKKIKLPTDDKKDEGGGFKKIKIP